MKTMTIHKAKTNLSRRIEKACEDKEGGHSRGSEPIARLVHLTDKTGRRRPGSLKGKLRVDREFFEPVPSSELKPWE